MPRKKQIETIIVSNTASRWAVFNQKETPSPEPPRSRATAKLCHWKAVPLESCATASAAGDFLAKVEIASAEKTLLAMAQA